jgi:hypothetical protein
MRRKGCLLRGRNPSCPAYINIVPSKALTVAWLYSRIFDHAFCGITPPNSFIVQLVSATTSGTSWMNDYRPVASGTGLAINTSAPTAFAAPSGYQPMSPCTARGRGLGANSFATHARRGSDRRDGDINGFRGKPPRASTRWLLRPRLRHLRLPKPIGKAILTREFGEHPVRKRRNYGDALNPSTFFSPGQRPASRRWALTRVTG